MIQWKCSKCGLVVNLEEKDFPIHCRCGDIGMVPYEEITDIEPIDLDVSNSPLDIMFILNYKSKVIWLSKKDCMENIFREHGISCEFINTYNDVNYLKDYILENRPRLYINTAMLTHERTISILARTFPSVKFLTINHSSQSDLFKVSTWMGSQNHHLMNMIKYPNCYFGLVDERNFIAKILEHPRVITLPNVVSIPSVSYPILHDTPTISLICRWDTLKNIPNQILGLCLLNKIRPIKVIYCFQKGSTTLINEMHEIFPLNYEIIPWGEWETYIKKIEDDIDIGLQVSFTESFNFVSIEHVLRGKPVVGSSAIRFLPHDCQASLDDPESICLTLLRVLENYEEYSKISRQLALYRSTENNNLFLKTIKDLL